MVPPGGLAARGVVPTVVAHQQQVAAITVVGVLLHAPPQLHEGPVEGLDVVRVGVRLAVVAGAVHLVQVGQRQPQRAAVQGLCHGVQHVAVIVARAAVAALHEQVGVVPERGRSRPLGRGEHLQQLGVGRGHRRLGPQLRARPEQLVGDAGQLGQVGARADPRRVVGHGRVPPPADHGGVSGHGCGRGQGPGRGGPHAPGHQLVPDGGHHGPRRQPGGARGVVTQGLLGAGAVDDHHQHGGIRGQLRGRGRAGLDRIAGQRQAGGQDQERPLWHHGAPVAMPSSSASKLRSSHSPTPMSSRACTTPWSPTIHRMRGLPVSVQTAGVSRVPVQR